MFSFLGNAGKKKRKQKSGATEVQDEESVSFLIIYRHF